MAPSQFPSASSSFSFGDSLNSPQSSASIDALIDRIHSLVRSIHTVGQTVNTQVQGISSRGQQTVDLFDSNFGEIKTDVEDIFGQANQRASEVPIGWLILLACSLGLLTLLALAWIGSILLEKILNEQRKKPTGKGRDLEQRRQ